MPLAQAVQLWLIGTVVGVYVTMTTTTVFVMQQKPFFSVMTLLLAFRLPALVAPQQFGWIGGGRSGGRFWASVWFLRADQRLMRLL